MGAVWLGRDDVLGRQVAMKRVGMAPGGSPDLLRAEREGRLAARLNHPHVVSVFDLVDEGDQQWLVMEYVEGSTLSELLQANGAMEPDQAAQIVVQAAEALAAAHEAGIVHRDVKPSNILVTPEGQAKLSDFGIARAEADASLTQTGLVTGSPAYISPEVASGQQATDLSDVWSLGATLFHALAGRPPYDIGDNVIGGLYRIVHEEPPRLDHAGWLAPLLESSMAVDPARRWSMRQVVEFLRAGPTATAPRPVVHQQAVATDTSASSTQVMSQTVPQPDPARPWRSRGGTLPLLLGVAMLVVLIVLALVVRLGGDDETDRTSPGTGASTRSPSAGQDSPRTTPDADDMTAFAESYLQTASADPAEGFGLLTPAYQAESDAYEDFWGNVSNVEVKEISADADALTVTYTYSYDFDGPDGARRVVETVTLQLVLQDGDYLISGAS